MVGHARDEGRQLRVGHGRLVEGPAANELGDPANARGHGAVVGRWRRRAGVHDLDRQRREAPRIGRRGVFVLVVVTCRDAGRLGIEREPIAIPSWAADPDLEAPVSRDVELRIVDDAGRPARHRAVLASHLQRDGDVDGAVHVPAHDVLAIARDRRVVVDRIGIVARELAAGRNDAPEVRAARVRLEHPAEATFEDVHERAVRTDDVGLAGEPPLGARPTLVDLTQEVDELTQGLAGFGSYRHGSSLVKRAGTPPGWQSSGRPGRRPPAGEAPCGVGRILRYPMRVGRIPDRSRSRARTSISSP